MATRGPGFRSSPSSKIVEKALETDVRDSLGRGFRESGAEPELGSPIAIGADGGAPPKAGSSMACRGADRAEPFVSRVPGGVGRPHRRSRTARRRGVPFLRGPDLSEFATADLFVDGVAERCPMGLLRAAVLCARGILEEGHKGAAPPRARGPTASCTGFFENLARRSVADPLLVVTDVRPRLIFQHLSQLTGRLARSPEASPVSVQIELGRADVVATYTAMATHAESDFTPTMLSAIASAQVNAAAGIDTVLLRLEAADALLFVGWLFDTVCRRDLADNPCDRKVTVALRRVAQTLYRALQSERSSKSIDLEIEAAAVDVTAVHSHMVTFARRAVHPDVWQAIVTAKEQADGGTNPVMIRLTDDDDAALLMDWLIRCFDQYDQSVDPAQRASAAPFRRIADALYRARYWS